MRRLLFSFFLLLFFSINSYCQKEYFVVLKKELPIQNNQLIQSLLSQVNTNYINASSVGIFSNNGVLKIKFFSKHVKGVVTNSLMSPLSDAKEEFIYLIKVTPTYVDEFVKNIKAMESFVHIQPNFTYTTFLVATDEPDYTSIQKDAMEFMRFSDIWSISSGEGIRIAVLDTGIYLNHREFCDGLATVDEGNQTMTLNTCTKIAAPFDFIDDATPGLLSGLVPVTGADYETIDSAPIDKDGHGSHVAGIAGANLNGFGMVGAAYNATIIPIRVLAPYKKSVDATVSSTGLTSYIINGINYAVTNNADIINLSLGGVLASDEDLLLQQAVDNATAQGVLVIAAAGNSNINFDSNRVAPAYFSNVLSVGSTTASGERSIFSNYGSSLDVAAFGGQSNGSSCIALDSVYSVSIVSNTAFKYLCGTSMSTPFVSGLAAIIKSYYKTEKSQTLKPSEIRRLIQISASGNTKTVSFGYGSIDGRNSLFLAGAALNDSNSSLLYVSDTGDNDQLICYPNPLTLSSNSKTDCSFFLNQSSSYQYWIFSRRGEILKTDSVSSSVGKQTISLYVIIFLSLSEKSIVICSDFIIVGEANKCLT